VGRQSSNEVKEVCDYAHSIVGLNTDGDEGGKGITSHARVYFCVSIELLIKGQRPTFLAHFEHLIGLPRHNASRESGPAPLHDGNEDLGTF
jgi:hypothetical protein